MIVGLKRKVSSEPVQSDVVSAVAFDSVDHDPQVVLYEKYRPAVRAATRLTPISVVLAFAKRPRCVILESKKARFGPVNNFELAVMQHLITSVKLHGVVARGPGEVLMPLRSAVVLVATTVDEHVLAAPPHVEVEHVD